MSLAIIAAIREQQRAGADDEEIVADLLARGVISAKAAPLVAEILARQAGDSRIVVSRLESQSMQSIGQSRQIELEKDGVLNSILDGSVRRITTSSIYDRQLALALDSYPAGEPEAKARQPINMRRKKIRPRTQAELDGLAEGNRQRAAKAAARREVKSQSKVSAGA
jgi:hypothetical protein